LYGNNEFGPVFEEKVPEALRGICLENRTKDQNILDQIEPKAANRLPMMHV